MNKVLFLPVGSNDYLKEVTMILMRDNEHIKFRNKYFEADVEIVFDKFPNPLAVVWVGGSSCIDESPPDISEFESSETKLLLRIVEDPEQKEISDSLNEWECDNAVEIFSIDINKFETEVKQFYDGQGVGLLDDNVPGVRFLEQLELVPWPTKKDASQSPLDQKINTLEALLKDRDDPTESFDKALSMIRELSETIRSLSDPEKQKYAAKVALMFEDLMGVEED